MESEWRYNVAFYQMANSNWRLCARGHEEGELAGRLLVDFGHPTVWRLYVVVPGQLPFPSGFAAKAGEKFPGRFASEVDPD